MGKVRLKGSVIVAPELSEWTAKEAEREAQIAKQLRKAREERKLAKPGNQGKDNKDGK